MHQIQTPHFTITLIYYLLSVRLYISFLSLPTKPLACSKIIFLKLCFAACWYTHSLSLVSTNIKEDGIMGSK